MRGYEQSSVPGTMGCPYPGPNHSYPPPFLAHGEVKQEFPEFTHGREMSAAGGEEGAAPTPTTELERGEGTEPFQGNESTQGRFVEDSSAAALEAELRATELELKVARLQAKRAALGQGKGK